MELQRLEFYVSRMCNLVICYFVFKNQSHSIVAFVAKGLNVLNPISCHRPHCSAVKTCQSSSE